MHLHFRLMLPLTLAFLPACAANDDSPAKSLVPSDAGSPTSSCPPWPTSKLFPLIGPFFGPDPGPCAMTSDDAQFKFNYANGVVLSLLSLDGSDTTQYLFDQSQLVSETRVVGSLTTNTTYEYAAEVVRTVTAGAGQVETAYEYVLDQRGYVQTARLLNPVTSASQPTHYSYQYDNCQLRRRIAYDRDSNQSAAVNQDATLEYSYDDAGHVVGRKSNLNDEQFDYSCW